MKWHTRLKVSIIKVGLILKRQYQLHHLLHSPCNENRSPKNSHVLNQKLQKHTSVTLFPVTIFLYLSRPTHYSHLWMTSIKRGQNKTLFKLIRTQFHVQYKCELKYNHHRHYGKNSWIQQFCMDKLINTEMQMNLNMESLKSVTCA
jgi:hypothetical protein